MSDHKKKYLKYKNKYLNLKKKQIGGSNKNTLNKWYYQENKIISINNKKIKIKNGPVKYYNEIVKKYGKPTIIINKKGGLCIWKNDNKLFPHDMLVLLDEYVQHSKPKLHFDFFYSYLKIYIPPKKLYKVLSTSGSINYDPLRHLLFARCGSFEANFATLRIVFNIINNKSTKYSDNINNKDNEKESNEDYVKRQVINNQKNIKKN